MAASPSAPLPGPAPALATRRKTPRRAADLLADEKECAEHLMLLDLGRNDVGRVAAWGSVTVTEQFIVERYSHVMHIVSHVEGDLREGLDAVDALFAGFPPPAPSPARPRFAPCRSSTNSKKAAAASMAAPSAISAGTATSTPALPCAPPSSRMARSHIQAGGGVVLDSDPQYEYEETLHKAGALKRAAARAAKFEFDQ